MDTNPPDGEGNRVCDEYPQPAFEEAPDLFARPPDAHASVIFDSDADDSDDDDGDQNRTHPGPETPPGTTVADSEGLSQAGGFVDPVYGYGTD